MNTLTKTVLSLAIGIATTAQAQQVIVIEGQREVVDPSALIGEDSGSFHLSRQSAATPGMGTVPTDARRSAMTDALVLEDSGAAYFASLPLGPGVDRIVVVADLDQARASGQLAALVSEDSGSQQRDDSPHRRRPRPRRPPLAWSGACGVRGTCKLNADGVRHRQATGLRGGGQIMADLKWRLQ